MALWEPKIGEKGGARRGPWEPKGGQRTPKGSQSEPKGRPKRAKGSQKGAAPFRARDEFLYGAIANLLHMKSRGMAESGPYGNSVAASTATCTEHDLDVSEGIATDWLVSQDHRRLVGPIGELQATSNTLAHTRSCRNQRRKRQRRLLSGLFQGGRTRV